MSDADNGQQAAPAAPKPHRGWPKGKPRKPLAEKLSAPVARPRTMASRPIFRKATIAELGGYQPKPDEVLFWAEADNAKHPNYIERYLDPRPVGTQGIGYCQPEPWEVVQRRSLPGLTGLTRDDQGKGKSFQGSVGHGSLVLVRTTPENFAIYQERDRLLREQRLARQKRGGEAPQRHSDTESGGGWSHSGMVKQMRDGQSFNAQQMVDEARRAVE